MADVTETPTPKRKVGLAAILIPIAVLSICGGALFSFSQYAVVSRVVATATGVPVQQASSPGEDVDGPDDPGTEQADIYSLGMVLYEITTGHDPLQFPELPAAAGISRSRTMKSRYSETNMSGYRGLFSGRYPMRRLASRPASSSGTPSRRISP